MEICALRKVTSSSSFGFWRIKNDDEERGDGPQEKRHNPPIQTASALRLREARVYEGESRPANCILTCFPNHHQTPRGIRSPARVLSSPKRRLLQKPILITAGFMQKGKFPKSPLLLWRKPHQSPCTRRDSAAQSPSRPNHSPICKSMSR